MKKSMSKYEIESTRRYEGAYTEHEVELNNRLYEECSKTIPDLNAIEQLLKQGADPLGATAVSGWGLLDHIYGEILCNGNECSSIDLPSITELFLKYGMDISNPRVPYDDKNSLNPMWSFAFVPNDNATLALKMLLDSGLDANSAKKFWSHAMFDLIDVSPCEPNNPDHNGWIVATFKMLMLLVSYDHILDNDEQLREFVGCSYNNYDTHKFREWYNFRYEFDTSGCEDLPEVYNSVVSIFEIDSNTEVWKIGVGLKEDELWFLNLNPSQM